MIVECHLTVMEDKLYQPCLTGHIRSHHDGFEGDLRLGDASNNEGNGKSRIADVGQGLFQERKCHITLVYKGPGNRYFGPSVK